MSVDENYIDLNFTTYARKRLGAVLEPLENRWLREIHYILPCAWEENTTHPPLQAHTTAGVMCLTTIAGISTILYKPDEYGPGKAGNHFKGLLQAHYPWNLDTPKNITVKDAIDRLYDELRNPLAHALGIKKGGVKIVHVLPATIYNNRLEFNKRIIDANLPFGGPSVTQEPTKLDFRPASFYWGIRKMLENMLQKDQDVDDLYARLKKIF